MSNAKNFRPQLQEDIALTVADYLEEAKFSSTPPVGTRESAEETLRLNRLAIEHSKTWLAESRAFREGSQIRVNNIICRLRAAGYDV